MGACCRNPERLSARDLSWVAKAAVPSTDKRPLPLPLNPPARCIGAQRLAQGRMHWSARQAKARLLCISSVSGERQRILLPVEQLPETEAVRFDSSGCKLNPSPTVP